MNNIGPNISLVTAFFDIGRGNWQGFLNGHPLPVYLRRDVGNYFHAFERLLKLDNDIVVFTSSDLVDRFKPYQDKKPNLTVIGFNDWVRDLHPEIRAKVSKIQNDPKFYSMVQQPWNPEYWSVSYIMVNLLKSYFVNYAIEWELVNTELLGWVDFAYPRSDDNIPKSGIWDYNFNPEKIHFFSGKRNVPHAIDVVDLIVTNNVLIHGCHIVAHKDKWSFFMTEMFKNMNILLDNNLVDDDQTLLAMCYVSDPEKYEIHYIDESNGGWFQAMTLFNDSLS